MILRVIIFHDSAIFGIKPQAFHTRFTVPNHSATLILLITSLSLHPFLLPVSLSLSPSLFLPPPLSLSLFSPPSLSLSLSRAVCFISSEFECDNGKCEDDYDECDGCDDCGDNSDEKDCGDNSGDNSGVMDCGMLSCTLKMVTYYRDGVK